MRTNLIQNYMINNNVAMGNTQPKEQPTFSVQEHLYNRTFIKPLPPKAKLVDGGILSAPKELVKDWYYEGKSLKDGIRGKANDHQLGKLNDVGMKVGGLAIACYLAARKSTPMQKTMEFVGLGSFLLAMSLWPKIAIQLPAKLIHNVNTRQSYEDAYGRKKPFNLDTQFLAFDLMSDKKIDKIGDWQRVPKDIPNRRDYIQEKIRKLAVQNNTLWMLTAGFATPVMSGLMCNALTPFIAKKIAHIDNKMNEKMLEEFPKSVNTVRDNSIINKVETFIEINKDRPVDDTLRKELVKIFTQGSNLVLKDGIERDITHIFQNDKFIVDNSLTEQISKNITSTLCKNIDEEIVRQIIPSQDQISEIFVSKNYLNNAYTSKEHRAIVSDIRRVLIENVKEFNKVATNPKLDVDFMEDLVSNVNIASDPIKKGLKAVPEKTFNVEMQTKVRKIATALTDFKAKEEVLHKYAYKKVAMAEDSTLAFKYNEMTKKLVKTLNIPPEEFENARYDRNLMYKLIRKTFEHIASDKTEYTRVMSDFADALSSIDVDIKQSDIEGYKKHLNTTFTDTANEFKDLGMKHTVARLIGLEPENGKGSYKKVMSEFVDDRIHGVKYAMYRFISTLDMFRRIATLENASVLTNPSIPREIKEAHLEMAKREALQSHSSDYAVKMYDLRNPHPDLTDFSNIEFDKDGNVIYKYFGKENGAKVDIPQDYKYFQNTMQLMDGDPLHNETQKILKSKNLLDKINQYRQNIIEILGGEEYFIKPEHIATKVTESTSEQKFLLSGIAGDEFFTKYSKQAFNSKKWLKMFGGFGAGLLGVTVLSQFFFGRVKLPENNNNRVQTNA